MEKPINDASVRKARKSLDMAYDSELSLETVSYKLMRAVQRDIGQLREKSESAIVLMQSIPSNESSWISTQNERFNIQGNK